MVRFANHLRDLSAPQLHVLTQKWERELARDNGPADAPLRLALTLNAPRNRSAYDRERARRLLTSSVDQLGEAHAGLREFARWQLASIERQPESRDPGGVLAVIRFADRARGLDRKQRQSLVNQWEQRMAEQGPGSVAALHLAALLGNPGRNTFGELNRARRLLKSYLATEAGKAPALLGFARYQLGLLDEGEHWLRAVERERRANAKLKQQLEALKDIERSMTDKDGNDKVPLQ